jgi:hypothetical protein
MTISLASLLSRVPPSVEARVTAARDRSRTTLRDALRTECRLVMRSADDADERGSLAQVPVEVVAGYPQILNSIAFADDLQHVLLLTRYRQDLSKAASGADGLIRLRGELRSLPRADAWAPGTDGAFTETRDWAREMLQRLDKQDPVSKVLAVNEDILGCYSYASTSSDEFAVNRASISLYWGVIGLVSDWLGCTVEDLTVVVLAHELAHAYTQLGADIEGRRWPSKAFSSAEIDLKEGLAQYYTVRSLKRLTVRFPEAMHTFETLLEKQPPAYHRHEPWAAESFSPEAVRRAMIEVRRWNEGTLEQFETRLKKASEDFKPLPGGLFH